MASERVASYLEKSIRSETSILCCLLREFLPDLKRCRWRRLHGHFLWRHCHNNLIGCCPTSFPHCIDFRHDRRIAVVRMAVLFTGHFARCGRHWRCRQTSSQPVGVQGAVVREAKAPLRGLPPALRRSFDRPRPPGGGVGAHVWRAGRRRGLGPTPTAGRIYLVIELLRLPQQAAARSRRQCRSS